MISWMQKHKKWLIVTIWISTIAFIGAGFVGWGSYDYGKSNSTVAIVGDKEVPMNDLQNEYNVLYSQYQQMFGESFNNELAKQLNLEDAALQRVVQKYLILNYAQELNLMTTDEEVASELVKINSFFKDGKFDKETYITVLKNNKRTAVEFEEQLKKDLLISKVQKIFNMPLTDIEIKNIGNLLYSENKISVNIIKDTNIKIKTTTKDLKEYWNKNKENYKSPIGFEISYSKIENIDGKTKKEMKKVALKEYLSLKKENSKFKDKETVYENSNFLPTEELTKIKDSKPNTILKPVYKDGSYYVIRFDKEIKPQVLKYDEVKDQIKTAFISSQKELILNNRANKIIKNFKGKDIGYINRNSSITIDGLDQTQTDELLKSVFSSNKKINSVKLPNTIVVYKIEDAKLATFDENNKETIKSIVEAIKVNSVSAELLKKLETKYIVKSFLGNK
ncbi:MAG: SurA N-terminal domain-containing protein [Campylobacterota bacterium]|nr:SurA N-terminal domain-containing protein [Campylobacterota bacterium]